MRQRVKHFFFGLLFDVFNYRHDIQNWFGAKIRKILIITQKTEFGREKNSDLISGMRGANGGVSEDFFIPSGQNYFFRSA
jgi:hypothetical protein